MRFTPKRPRTWRAGAAEKVLDLVCILFSDKAKGLYKWVLRSIITFSSGYGYAYLCVRFSYYTYSVTIFGAVFAIVYCISSKSVEFKIVDVIDMDMTLWEWSKNGR